MAHALSRLGLSVTVFCGGAKQPTVLHEDKDLRVLRMPMARVPPRVVFFQLQNLSLLKSVLPYYDVVHTQHSSGSLYGIIKKKVGKPWVVSFHDHQLRRLLMFFDVKPWNLTMSDTMFYAFAYPIFEALTRMELKWADHYVACGRSGLMDYLNFSKMDPRKVTLIPNGVNLGRIDSILNSSDVEGKSGRSDLVLFTCGRWYASKGIQFLIRAMPYVKKRFNNVRLKVFGKGPMRPYFERLIHSLKLEGTVRLEGLVPYDRLILEMSDSDLAVFPSMIEVGASLAVMEAMACRKPLIAFEYPFSLEIIKHMRTGVLVPPKNVEALGERICYLLSDEALRKRIGRNAREDVVRNHDVKNIALKYVEVYASVLS